MSTQSDLGQCVKCLREGVSRPGVIDYTGSLVCQDHYEKDRALDGEIEPIHITARDAAFLDLVERTKKVGNHDA